MSPTITGIPDVRDSHHATAVPWSCGAMARWPRARHSNCATPLTRAHWITNS